MDIMKKKIQTEKVEHDEHNIINVYLLYMVSTFEAMIISDASKKI